jgi:hypothetical protein
MAAYGAKREGVCKATLLAALDSQVLWVEGSDNMGTHMKTTIEISDAILEQAKRVAVEEGTTLRSLVEEGLRRVVAEHSGGKSFELRDGRFKGKGLQPDVKEGSWELIRDIIYQGRGG